MKDQTCTDDVAAFLEKAHALVASGKYDFVPRKKNMQALAQYGLTVVDAKNEILELIVDNYYKGPKLDLNSDRNGYIWEFKKNINSIQFYIKIKILQINGEDVLRCLSFHEDDFA